ncbi:MAG: peptidoglycan-binding protein [Deferrisomatales bacterium]|nr:peptidoglycan-binding protein [Deferrisomatales bacterium]
MPRRTVGRFASSAACFTAAALLVLLAFPANPAQANEAEQNYQRFKAIYRQSSVTAGELENARSFLETANLLAPNTYKYVFGLGAVNSTLKRWEPALEWFKRAQSLSSTGEEEAGVQAEIDYCQTQIAKVRVSSWSPEGVEISFIMKEGTVEMDESTVHSLPRRLPATRVGDSPDPVLQVLRSRLGSAGVQTSRQDPFLVVALDRDRSPDVHYEKGVKEFYRYFQAQYFEVPPQRLLVVILSSYPDVLVEATDRLYPEVGIPVYAPFLGYYNPADNLIMATGGSTGYGTLLHEMIHALVEGDFPDAPPWLNEGLASLYERSQWRANRLQALPNWRMDRISEKGVPPLQSLAGQVHEIGLHSAQIAHVRLLLLFLDQREQTDDLYRMVKEKGSAFSLDAALSELGATEEAWRAFVTDTFRDYKTEIARGQGRPSNPHEIRFMQEALNLVLGTGLTVDGFWGSVTEEKVVEFQNRFGLQPDGVPGPATMARMRKQYALARLERLENTP